MIELARTPSCPDARIGGRCTGARYTISLVVSARYSCRNIGTGRLLVATAGLESMAAEIRGRVRHPTGVEPTQQENGRSVVLERDFVGLNEANWVAKAVYVKAVAPWENITYAIQLRTITATM